MAAVEPVSAARYSNVRTLAQPTVCRVLLLKLMGSACDFLLLFSDVAQ